MPKQNRDIRMKTWESRCCVAPNARKFPGGLRRFGNDGARGPDCHVWARATGFVLLPCGFD
eukprot:8207898-Lingulodinium_polyedra.AAC.1